MSLIKIRHQLKSAHRSNVINIHLSNHSTKNAFNINRKDRINVFQSNVRSLLPKVDDLQTTLKLHGVDLAFITETWFNENIDYTAVQVPNCIIVRRDRSSRIGGGGYAYINLGMPYKVLHELHDDDFETLWIYIRPRRSIRGYSSIIVCVPPNCDKKDFVEHLIGKLDSALRLHPNAGIFMVGEFNKSPISSLVRNFSLKQIVKGTTRNDAILDLILTNMSEFCDPVHVTAPGGRSDHNSVLCSLQNTSKGNQVTKVSVRRGRPGSKQAFPNWLTKGDWLRLSK